MKYKTGREETKPILRHSRITAKERYMFGLLLNVLCILYLEKIEFRVSLILFSLKDTICHQQTLHSYRARAAPAASPPTSLCLAAAPHQSCTSVGTIQIQLQATVNTIITIIDQGMG